MVAQFIIFPPPAAEVLYETWRLIWAISGRLNYSLQVGFRSALSESRATRPSSLPADVVDCVLEACVSFHRETYSLLLFSHSTHDKLSLGNPYDSQSRRLARHTLPDGTEDS